MNIRNLLLAVIKRAYLTGLLEAFSSCSFERFEVVNENEGSPCFSLVLGCTDDFLIWLVLR